MLEISYAYGAQGAPGAPRGPRDPPAWPLGATPGVLKLHLRAFEPQMSPPYDSALIQMLSLLFFNILY